MPEVDENTIDVGEDYEDLEYQDANDDGDA